MATISRLSPAKINLTLRVGPTRPDGFHEIESLVARVGLCDTVNVTLRDDGQLSLACDDPAVPGDETNLALRAARRLREATGVRNRGVDIALEKRIPPGAGLGGGSSNAATVLMLLNELWRTELPPTELATIGAEIGSDVPLFFHSPLCIVRGRGELVEDAPRTLAGWVVLVMPSLHSMTRDVYAAWDRLESHAPRPSPEQILKQADSPATLMEHLFNGLEEPAFRVSPQLSELSERLNELAEGPVRMTGSGSAFFRLFDSEAEASFFADQVRAVTGCRAWDGPLDTRTSDAETP
jgi:4-diphosphocytidyl-2-C-methyl-D-erythritol kinase